MSNLHYVSAALAFSALMLLLYNTGRFQVGPWLRMARIGFALLLAFLGLGFLQLATQHAPFLARHALTAAALAVIVFGYLGYWHSLRRPQR